MGGRFLRAATLATLLALAPTWACAQDATLRDEPALSAMDWAVSCDVAYPLEPLVTRGLLPVGMADLPAPTLAMVSLPDGRVLWQVAVDGAPRALTCGEGLLFAATAQRLLAIEEQSGLLVWEQPLAGRLDDGHAAPADFRQAKWYETDGAVGQAIGGALLSYGDRLYLTLDGTLYGLQAASGQVAWAVPYGQPLTCPAIAADGLVYVATEQDLKAVRADVGAVAWVRSGLGRVEALYPMAGRLYAATTKGLLRLDPGSGAPLWLTAMPYARGMRLTAIGDRLVVQRKDEVCVVRATDGLRLWGEPTGPQQSLVEGAHLYLRSDAGGDIFCLSVPEMRYLWRAEYCRDTLGRLIPAGDAILAVSGWEVAAYAPETGQLLWRRLAPAGLMLDATAWSVGPGVAAGKTARRLQCLDPLQGTWLAAMPGDFSYVQWIHAGQGGVYVHSGPPDGVRILAGRRLQSLQPAANGDEPAR